MKHPAMNPYLPLYEYIPDEEPPLNIIRKPVKISVLKNIWACQKGREYHDGRNEKMFLLF